jgi:signal transduction histidine kinase
VAPDLTLGAERFLATTVDVTPERTPGIRLTVLKSYDQTAAFLHSLNRWISALGVLAMLGGGAVIYRMSATITKPLADLVDGVHALERGDFDYPLDLGGRDEVSQLTAAFDRMRRTVLEAQRRLVDNERLAVIGRMASSISHDLRHPLTAILAYAEFLADGSLTSEQRRDSYEEIRLAVNRMTDQITSLLGFSRKGEALQLTDTRLDEPIARAAQTVRVLPEFSGVAVTWTCDPGCRGWVDAGKVERVVLNLLFNACEAVSPTGGTVHVDGRCEADTVEIRVTDNGPGIPFAIRDTLFEPFSSADKEKGIGLGLTAVHMIVREHGGQVCLERTGPDGTVFRVSLPSQRPPQPPAAAEHR